jgi:hypothetical protein
VLCIDYLRRACVACTILLYLTDKGNEEWVSSLVKKGDLVEKDR